MYAVPDLDTYLMTHDIYLRRKSDGQDIPITALTISTDADSWAWSLSAGIAGHSAVADISDGMIVEAGIDGYRWEFIAEQTSESQQFPGASVTLTGRSQTALLAAPYLLPRDKTNTGTSTAQQLALDELPLTGWTLQWSIVDWNIPAGAWTYQGITAIDAISRLAQAAGGIIQSARTGQAIIAQPRRKVWPWQYQSTAADYSIPWDACITTQRLSQPAGSPNVVHVHGSEHGGILARVTLATSAGDKPIPTVVNALLTDSIPARELGGRLLAEQQPPCRYKSASIPLTWSDGDYPLMQVGDLIGISTQAEDEKGICTALSVTVQTRGKGFIVRQTATLDDGAAANPYARLRQLVPDAPILVGTVISQSGANSVNVELIGGGQTTVNGTAANGSSIFIQSGRVISPAPALQSVEIAI
jgi:hypothetical protein